MISPQDNFRLVQALVTTRTSPQAVRAELLQAQDVNRPLNTQVVQFALNVHLLHVLIAQVVQHRAVDLCLAEHVLVLRQADIVQPLCHPHLVDKLGVVDLQLREVGHVVHGLEKQGEPLAVQRVLDAQLFLVVTCACLKQM